MYSWEKERINEDKLLKKKVLESLKKKPDYKKIKKEAEKKFVLRKIISRTFLGGVQLGHFVTGNNEWGYAQHKSNMRDYKNILKIYAENKFEKKVLDLLIKSKNQTPQVYNEVGKKPCEYSNNHDPKNPYKYSYCNITKIDFFKGILSDEKKITKLGYDKLFSQSFVYGYIEAMITIIFKLGALDESVYEKPKFRRYFKFPGSPKGSGSGIPINDMRYDKRFIRNKRLNLFEKIFNISYSEANQIINNLEDSIFQSTLSNFLIIKGENYYVNMFNSFIQTLDDDDKNYESTADFFIKIKKKKENKYNKGYKYERINKIHKATRNLQKLSGSGPVTILNYEQFRFYNFRIPYLEPYNEKKLNLNEKDILIRYAIYLGVQEANYYINQIIFSPE